MPAARSPRNNTKAGAFSITRLTKGGLPLPKLPYASMKDRVLGRHYLLSLVLAGDAYAQGLNRRYRKKSYVPNVLSFPLNKKNGEIVLNLGQAKKECAVRGESFRFFVALLFVHSLLHLKGRHHGGIMESEERTVLAKFHIINTFRPRKGK